MADISISLSEIDGSKLIEIKPLGDFRVRQLGAGESLDLSTKIRRHNEIIMELDSFDLMKFKDKELTSEDEKAIQSINERVMTLNREIEEIDKARIDIYKRAFDDMGSGNTEVLFQHLNLDARIKLLNQIFNPTLEIKENTDDQS